MKLISTLLAPMRRLIAACLPECHPLRAATYPRKVAGSRASVLFHRHMGASIAAFVLLWVAASAVAQAPAESDELARSIVEKADHSRLPQDPFQVDVSITTTAPGKDPEIRKYRILSKGNDNTIVLTLEPLIDRGQILLMRGHDLWIFMPNLSQPVRLSVAQRLTGQVANGDLARANFAGDYAPTVIGTRDCGNELCYLLELAAVDRSVTYHRVVYWVAQKTGRPIRAEFYSLSDQLLKTAVYRNVKKLGGQTRPTEILITNALRAEEESLLEYSNLKPRDLPDKMFTKEYLKKLDY
jgi:outer membrane lipoprotein-sorting protein